MSMVCEMNRTDPSARQNWAPPLWRDLYPKDMFQFAGPLGGVRVPQPPTSSCTGTLIGMIVVLWDIPPLNDSQCRFHEWSVCVVSTSPTAIVLDRPSLIDAKFSITPTRLNRPRM